MPERGRQHHRMDRRSFLRVAGGAAVAMPSMAAILAACSKPTVSGGSSGASPAFQIATQDHPVTLPMNGRTPVSASTPMEDATLQIYNWDSYMYKKVLADWEAYADRKYEWTTFNNMAEGESKLEHGQVTADVFFPTVDILGKLVANDLLQPLQHDLIPNIKNMWPEFSGTDSPWYDQGWRYTVPYATYTTGILYRRDHISDAEVADKGYEIFWDPKYKGKIGVYDDYRETLGMAMMRRGLTDVNTGDPAVIDTAKQDLIDLTNTVNVRVSINGSYVGVPNDDFWIHQAWSGDAIGAQWYMPKGVSPDVLGFYLPDNFAVGSDTITIPSSATSPVMAHNFLNYFMDVKAATKNFSWNGYQPPLVAMQPDKLVAEGYVPQTVSKAVVVADQFDKGHTYTALTPEVNQLWQDAFDEFKAGA